MECLEAPYRLLSRDKVIANGASGFEDLKKALLWSPIR